ncbi:MAG TPA: nuclear transport factor 2 family protein [Acidobacteriaceae bacterium]|nr:nuclear transport factor 2 family protein [Acidobacteriaceae bacterium]
MPVDARSDGTGAEGGVKMGSESNQGEVVAVVENAKEAVLSYIRALEAGDYAAARRYLADNVRVKGPSGEAFRSPDEFLKMMEQQRGKYDIKKVFVDGGDVCLLYDFITPKVTAFSCSWYRVRGGKIRSIQTVFDPRAFAAA